MYTKNPHPQNSLNLVHYPKFHLNSSVIYNRNQHRSLNEKYYLDALKIDESESDIFFNKLTIRNPGV